MAKEITDLVWGSEGEYYKLFNDNTAVMLLIDPSTGNILDANNATSEFYGYSHNKLTRMKIQDINVLSEEQVKEEMDRAKKKEQSHFLFEHRLANGIIRHVEVYSGEITINDIPLLFSIVHDITERKNLEELFKESEERYRTIFENAGDGIFILNSDKTIRTFNEAFARMHGYSVQEMSNMNLHELDTPESYQRVDELMGKIVDGYRQAFETNHIHKQGHIINLEVNSTPIIINNENCFVAFHRDITKRKQIEEEITYQKELLQRVVDNIPVMVTYFDKNGKILLINKEIIRCLGWTFNEWETENIFAKCYPEPNYAKEVLDFMNSEGSGWKDCKTITKFGTTLDTSWTNIKLPDGVSMGIGYDITERKKAEEKLRDSEELYRRLFNEDLAGNFVSTIDGQLLQCNPAYAVIMGFESVDEMLKAKTQTFYKNPDDRNSIIKGIRENKKLINYEYHLIRKDGKEINAIANIFGKFDKTGNLIQLSGYMIDLTKLKEAELELIRAKEIAEANEEQFRNLFEHSPIGKSMTGIDGSLYVNKSFCEIVGYSKEELKSKNWTEISYPEDIAKTNEVIHSLLNGDIDKAFFEKRYIHKNGNIVWTDVSTYLQRDKENKPQFFITTIIDITARKHYENDLIAAKEKAEESERLKSAFLTNMSHEIRTPMNGILGFAELLKEPSLTTGEKQDFIKTITNSGERLLNTINAIVDISKIESGMTRVDISEANINDKLDFAYTFFKHEAEDKGLQLILSKKLIPEEAYVNTDNEKVYSILTNLIKNAIKFTNQGSLEFGCEKNGDYLRFFVKDTGVGIPENHKEFIFDRFRQGSESHNRDYEGSGLGLSISKNYVEMLGGRIWFESEIGKGTIFNFTIPYIRISGIKMETKKGVEQYISGIQNNKLKIMIVEDDEVSYSLLIRMIQGISSKIIHATNGKEAVQFCQENPDIDLILMDIRMPVLSGLEATKQIRQFNKEKIIIAQTAYGFTSDCEKALAAGCNDYISKPVNRTALIGLINKYCFK